MFVRCHSSHARDASAQHCTASSHHSLHSFRPASRSIERRQAPQHQPQAAGDAAVTAAAREQGARGSPAHRRRSHQSPAPADHRRRTERRMCGRRISRRHRPAAPETSSRTGRPPVSSPAGRPPVRSPLSQTTSSPQSTSPSLRIRDGDKEGGRRSRTRLRERWRGAGNKQN